MHVFHCLDSLYSTFIKAFNYRSKFTTVVVVPFEYFLDSIFMFIIFLSSHLLALRKHAHMIYSNFVRSKIDNFQRKIFDIFLIFAQAVLTSTHNLCFGAKIRKIGMPLHTPVLLYKSGV